MKGKEMSHIQVPGYSHIEQGEDAHGRYYFWRCSGCEATSTYMATVKQADEAMDRHEDRCPDLIRRQR